ncbi:MAG: insulinase family protein [Rhodospirillales bacterium]|nr:insulinase family protein [Alphaproteobacteria bacterium]MCB9986349.1 insulinase family protein [Rhodospirillales bacterium]USO07102.1 MAG: insulinase family protein [Rhodospirillales bacterium]
MTLRPAATRLFLFSAFFVLAMAACAPASALAGVYNAQTATLKNGMQVVVIPNHRTPALTHMIWYKSGAGDEPIGVSGTAHFMEHLMFKGTPTLGPGKFSETVQRMGGEDNAFTSWDYTAYHETVPKDRLGDVMRMEADRMKNLTPTLPDILHEKQVVMEERRQNVESDPGVLLRERMNNVLFPNHPYGRPVIGWMPEMQGLRWVDALTFYKKWYAPDNAILVVSGDTTLDQVLPLAEATYGKIPAQTLPHKGRPVSPVLEGEIAVIVQREDIRQPSWQRELRVPSAPENPDAALRLELLEDLFGGDTGRLYRELVVKQKIATDVDVSYNPYARDDGTWLVYATPAPGVDMQKLAGAVNAVFENASVNGFTPQEVRAAITRMQDDAVYARDSLAGPAMRVGEALAVGVKLDDIESWPDRLEKLTPIDAQAALNTYIAGKLGVSGFMIPLKVEGLM